MADNDEVNPLFRRYRREAVLLHRPWPPHAGPRTHSHLGGLPRLPETHAWPRTSAGTRLHFLAQIDCADIPFKTALPERGVLFFFGRDDTDAWMAASPATDHCRVLYAPDSVALTPPRQPPADLAPLGFARKWLNVHPAWPVVPLRFDSFPGGDALPHPNDRDARGWRGILDRLARGVRGVPEEPEIGPDVREAYDAELYARRAAALVAATGAQPPGTAMTWREAGAAIFHFAASGPQSFPQHWACIHHLARAILDRPLFYSLGEAREGERVAAAEGWLDRSREGPLDRPVAEDDRQALRTWLATLGDKHDLVCRGAAGTIRSWAGDPALAALVPGHVYAACAPFFYGYREAYPQFSQMLGHSPGPHVARPVGDPTICLLNLDTDLALGWYFGEGGQCTFWITPGDLARRDFSRVEGRLDGDGH
ncbi:MAG TPA: DUF1963 domain-containing protein [Longimicrobium sp.]|nr:DUF1963 domain-containing protein [Longimicrobium sp.]